MISYTVESKEYDDIGLPPVIVSVMKKSDELKSKYIVAVACAKKVPAADDFIEVTYRDALGNVYVAELKIVEVKA